MGLKSWLVIAPPIRPGLRALIETKILLSIIERQRGFCHAGGNGKEGFAMRIFERLFDLGGKTALVTGGATGLGRIAAATLLEAGARVLIASRKEDACRVAAAELAALGPCEGFGGDLGSEAGVLALADEVRARTERLDILVNNAGATWGATFETFDWAAWQKVLSVNVMGLFCLTRELMPLLLASANVEAPSRVVNLGSVVGTMPLADGAYSYATSKAGVHHLTRILAQEFAARHVTVNALAPGPFESRMTAFALGKEEGRAVAANAIPMGRIGQQDDIAGALLFLCGRGGAYTTGCILPVDGGMHVATRSHMYAEDE
jgi:NAD(P)-dependent dehydrogenase (short-subunit alcohol dehydrogenase family)